MLWILIGLSIILKVHGYADGFFPESCESMSVKHDFAAGRYFAPQTSEPPFEVTYQHGNEEEPMTVFLKSKSTANFKGFMLEARKKDTVDEGPPVGKFILLQPDVTRLLTCNDVEGSAVSKRGNRGHSEIKVNWTAPGEELNITFRATFVQEYETFWERVDVDVTLPPPTTPPPTTTKPSTTTSTTKPSTTTSTTMSTTKPSTTTSTAKPSTPVSTTKPSTTTSTAKPSTTVSTTKPSTPVSTTKPSTTTSTAKPSTTVSTTKPSTTTSTAKPSTKISTTMLSTTVSTTTSATTNTTKQSNTSIIPSITLNNNSGQHSPSSPSEMTRRAKDISGTLMTPCKVTQAVIVALPIIAMTTPNDTPSSCLKIKVSNILCSLLCFALEIPALILIGVGDSLNVTLISLECVVIAINFIEVVIVSLSFGPSHELKEIRDIAVKVSSIILLILQHAVIFVIVLDTDDYRENKKESWLLKVMIAYTVWTALFVIWVCVFSFHRNAILGKSKLGNSGKNKGLRQHRRKKKSSAAEVVSTAVSVIFIIGETSFAAAVFAGFILRLLE